MIEMEKYIVNKIKKTDLKSLINICKILYLDGKYMFSNYNLNHWNNSYIKTFLIVLICNLKNDIYIVKADELVIATFQIKVIKEKLYFQKLGTHPEYMNRGIGKFCLMSIEKIAKSLNCNEIFCEVYEKSEHAKKFYEKNGYKVYGNLKTLKYMEIELYKELRSKEQNL